MATNKKLNKKTVEQFPGFTLRPQRGEYWPYPKIMDKWWCVLKPREQKVLDYILRHTWGFKKSCDHISYSQFLNGIKKKNGQWFDKGCGIKSSATLKLALDGLINKGFIIIVEKSKGKSTFYGLRLEINKNSQEKPLQEINNTSSDNNEASYSENKDTITDITIKDDQNNIYTINKEIVIFLIHSLFDLYKSLLEEWFREQFEGLIFTENIKRAIYYALKKYGARKLIIAMANQFNQDNRFWVDKHSKRGLSWFFSNRKLLEWIERNQKPTSDGLSDIFSEKLCEVIKYLKEEGKKELVEIIFPGYVENRIYGSPFEHF